MSIRASAALAAAIATTWAAGSGPAVADDPTAGVDANLYRPAFDSNGIFTVESATGLPKYDLSFKLGVGFSQKPLQLPVPGIGDGADSDSVLEFALAGHFTVALALTDKLSVGVDAGLYRTNPDEGYGERGIYSATGLLTPNTGLQSLRATSNFDPAGNFQPEQLAGPLDARAGVKYSFYDSGSIRMAALGTVSAPFGEDELFLGDQNLVFEPKLAIDYLLDDLGASKLIFNLGARIRQRTVIEAYDTNPAAAMTEDDALVVLDVGSEAVAALGITYELLPQLIVGAEATWLEPLPEALDWGRCRLHDGGLCSNLDDNDYFAGGGRGDRASFALGGVEYRATPDVSLTVMGGAGLSGARSEDFRLMTGIIWQPTPAGTRVIGRGDSDTDGVPDATDICENEPEDRDGYQDEDGCPDLDNDGDGIIDASDACPDAPEDKDGYQDEDGCPERDNDGDAVPDVTDRCPNDPEDRDGFDDDDGCPDEDNDGDGFADAKDKCPNEPETVNGIDDNDGCPDGRKGGPQWQADRIDLQGSKIAFTSARSSKLTAASKTILDQVAELMKEKKDAIVRIESHVPLSTNSKNRRTIRRAQNRDKSLTDKRAKEVFDYLVGKGVDPQQLRRDSLGSGRPLRQPATDPINDRIEFIRQ
jgi:outer membrane protein OmpA-like peptidoglycan-associated protein